VKRFLAGFVAGGIGLLVLAVLVAQLGVVDVRADAAMPGWFGGWFSAAVHKSVRRQAASVARFAPATEAEVIAGGKLFVNDCVGCHSEPGKPASDFGATFYPPAPQLAQEGTKYTEEEIFWIAKHGIRRTGMSAQTGSYSDEKLRSLAAFIYRMENLPPNIAAAIHEKTEGTGAPPEPQK
jgi:cytochrome c553